MKKIIKKGSYLIILSTLLLSCATEREATSVTNPTVNYAAMYPAGTVFCNNVVTAVVDVTNPITGKTWMDRNLGASRVATSSTDELAYGDLYQWGRRADGHQCRNSPTISVLSSSDVPNHAFFISILGEPYDWRRPQNINLWQGVNGVNNPCPNGYRLPTLEEANQEKASWNSNNEGSAFSSKLKLPAAGLRYPSGGIFYEGKSVYSWTSSVTGSNAYTLDHNAQFIPIIPGFSRGTGATVRCIKN